MTQAAIFDGANNGLPLAKKSPGVAHAQPIQQMVVKQKAVRIAINALDATSDMVTQAGYLEFRLLARMKAGKNDGSEK
jgi:hypothetical protein